MNQNEDLKLQINKKRKENDPNFYSKYRTFSKINIFGSQPREKPYFITNSQQPFVKFSETVLEINSNTIKKEEKKQIENCKRHEQNIEEKTNSVEENYFVDSYSIKFSNNFEEQKVGFFHNEEEESESEQDSLEEIEDDDTERDENESSYSIQ